MGTLHGRSCNHIRAVDAGSHRNFKTDPYRASGETQVATTA
jgi:hypothetical protein